jgi:flagellar protein FlaI
VRNLPFSGEGACEEHGGGVEKCSLHGLLPPPLKERVAEAPHLLDYLHQVPIGEVGMPEFYPELSRKLGDLERRNLIYPVASDVFVHIYEAPGDARDYYISIDPSLVAGLEPSRERLERSLLDYVEALERAETPEAKAEVLVRAAEENCVVISDKAAKSAGNGKSKRARGPGLPSQTPKAGAKIPVTAQQLVGLKYVIVRDKIGMGVLEPLIKDPYIEDISCSGLGPIFIEHKIFKGLRSNISFDRNEELDDFVLRLSAKIKKPVTYKKPIVDASLPDGSRINIVYGGDVSKRGTNFTIRKFTEIPLSILDILEGGALNYQMAAYLWLMVSEGMNVWASGETASGKTTLLNALTGFIQPSAKIVTIEDTPELQVPHPNWIREVGVVSAVGEDSSVTMFSLLKAALRQRPNNILVGEVRGEEGAVAFQAMQTGHSVMSTFHASTVEKLIQRLTGAPINVPKAYIDNLNVVVLIGAVRLPSGKRGRRILSIAEIIDYDSESDSFSFIEVFRWNSAQDVFEFTGSDNSYLLEQAIAPRRGIDSVNKRAIYDELERRAALLERLHKTGKTNFYDLYQVISRAQREGLV